MQILQANPAAMGEVRGAASAEAKPSAGCGKCGEDVSAVSQGVTDLADFVESGDAQSNGGADGSNGRGGVRRFDGGELPKSGPAAGGGAALQKPAVLAMDADGPSRKGRYGAGFPRRGDGLLQAGRGGPAEPPQRTVRTTRLPRSADRGAQFHQGGIELAAMTGGEDLPGQLPQPPQRCGLAGVGVDFFQSAQDPRHVAVEDGRSFVECDGGDCPRGVPPDAGKGPQITHGSRDLAVETGDDFAGGGADISGAGVIAQSLPQSQDVPLGRRGEGGNVGKGGQEAGEIRHNRGDLRLLEHKLADQHGIGIDGTILRRRRTPWQIAAISGVPRQQCPNQTGPPDCERDVSFRVHGRKIRRIFLIYSCSYEKLVYFS